MGHLTYSVTSPQLQIEGSSHDNARVGPEVVLLTPTNLVNPQVPSLVTRAPRFVGEMNAEEAMIMSWYPPSPKKHRPTPQSSYKRASHVDSFGISYKPLASEYSFLKPSFSFYWDHHSYISCSQNARAPGLVLVYIEFCMGCS
ncbi:hypothetical protein OPQ81_010616 [Rhizoctonia solani]|nr:hypothetical protein OPQ81_010616 [Rhizoctonia solani]